MRRGIRVLLVLVVVLGGLFVAADRLAVSFAESKAADRIQSARGLSAKPSVSIKGFPFLTQLLDKDLSEVTVTAADLQTSPGAAAPGAGPLRIARFTADLHDVRTNGDYSGATADTATGTALISYAELSKAAPSGVTVSYGGPDSGGKGQVKVTGSLVVPGIGAIQRSVVSEVAVSGGDTVSLHARSIPGGDTIPGLDRLVRRKTDFTTRLSGLPHGITLDSVQATPDGLQFSLTGKNVPLTG